MTEKWADYLIIAVRFNSAGTHIDAVRIREDNGDSVGPVREASRAQIIASIEAGTTFCTATTRSDGKLQKGAAVRIVVIESKKYITTRADGIRADNLDDLPTF